MAVSVHKWLLNKFRDINHSRMDKHIDIIAKNSGKSKAYIKFDIIRNFLIRATRTISVAILSTFRLKRKRPL